MFSLRKFRRVGISALVATATLIPALSIAAQPRTPFAVAAVFPPWWSAQRVHAAAEAAGTVSQVGRWNTVVVYGGTDLGARLTQVGAWAIVDPSIADCAVSGVVR